MWMWMFTENQLTPTAIYLDFLSSHPLCHKRSVVNTLLRRAKTIPSTNEGRREETQRVKAVLRENNYPLTFINNCERALTRKPADINFNGFVVLPYVQGVSERIGRVLKQQVGVSYRPQVTINSLFPRPKEQDDSDRQRTGIVRDDPAIGYRPVPEPGLKPGIVQFWNRPVLRLKIDPNQLKSDGRLRGHSALLPRNDTNEVNGSNFRAPFQHANCTWIEYDANGTLKITAREVTDEEKERKAFVQGYLELTLSSISIVAVILSLIILSCLRIRNSERIFVHKNLLLSLCLVYIAMILDTFVFTNRKQTPKLCSAMAVIQHLTHTAIFTWMLVEGIHLYIKLVKVFSVNKLYITYIIIGWGLPAVIVGLIAAIRPETYDMSKTYYKDVMCGSLKLTAEIMRDRCWLHDGEWLYKAPILAILLVNLAIFVVLLRVIFTKISTKYQTDNVEKTKRGLKSVAALLPLLGVTWLLGFVVHWSEVLLYLFIILNSLQGLAFCIFHSLLDDQIRESLIRSIRRTRMKPMARFDRSSIASTSTQLTPPGSINGRENFKHRGDIQTSKSFDTKL
ncbi:hypothetical protein ACROYT_G004496 [Oculina patagonica]